MTCSEGIDTAQRTLGEWLDKRGMPATLAVVVSFALAGLIWWNLSEKGDELEKVSEQRIAREAAQCARVEKLEAKVDEQSEWQRDTLAEITISSRHAIEASTQAMRASTEEQRQTREQLGELVRELRAERTTRNWPRPELETR